MFPILQQRPVANHCCIHFDFNCRERRVKLGIGKTPQLLQSPAGTGCFPKQKSLPTPISEKPLAL